MKLFILGTGDAFSSKNYSTCFIVQSDDGFNIGVECPHPYLKILSDARAIENSIPDIKDIDNFIITHLHSDHCGGLETIGFYKKFVENKTLKINMSWSDYEKVCSMMEPGMGSTILNGKISQMFPLSFFDFFEPLDPFTVHSKPTLHCVPSRALLIKEGDKTIGFSGDTSFNMDVIKWLNQADIILHETGPAPGHTPLENLLSLPDEIKEKIILIHYGDNVDTDEFNMAQMGEVLEI